MANKQNVKRLEQKVVRKAKIVGNDVKKGATRTRAELAKGSKTIGRDLQPVLQPCAKAHHEQESVFGGALSDEPRRDELRVRADSDPRPYAADALLTPARGI